MRIIGGAWRGRLVTFADQSGLRPTPDRVRETLFNWLQGWIVGAHCLDLFAGSGVLGLEAVSRGAARVVMVDRQLAVAHHLRAQVLSLGATQVEVLCSDALDVLATIQASFDIVFVDPPYGQGLLPQALGHLAQRPLLTPHALVYFEFAAAEPMPPLAAHWRLLHIKRAGQVAYALAQVENPVQTPTRWRNSTPV